MSRKKMGKKQQTNKKQNKKNRNATLNKPEVQWPIPKLVFAWSRVSSD
jgi:hypothetical protein